MISSVFLERPADPKGVKRVIVSAKPLPIIYDNRIFARAVLDWFEKGTLNEAKELPANFR